MPTTLSAAFMFGVHYATFLVAILLGVAAVAAAVVFVTTVVLAIGMRLASSCVRMK